MGKWSEVALLEKGWDINDVEVEAGIVSSFGRVVAVDEDLIVVGAEASIGNVIGGFVFKKTRLGWDRVALSPPYSERLSKVNQVSVRNGLALIALSDPPYPVERDGSVYLFEYNSMNGGALTLTQKLQSDECKSFGDLAALLSGGGIILSCVGDGGDIELQYYNTSGSGSEYTLQQRIIALNVSNDNGGTIQQASWLAIDNTSQTIALSSDGTVRLFIQSNGMWRELTFMSSPINGITPYGSIAIAGNKVLIETKDNVAAYTLEESNDC